MASEEEPGGFSFFFLFRQIFSGQEGKRRIHGENVGKELGGRQREEYENKEGPYEEETECPVGKPGFPAGKNAGNCAGPREEPRSQNDQVQVNVILTFMLRADETGHIVVAQKGIEEIISVKKPHAYIPGKADQTGQRNSPVPFEGKNVFQTVLPGQEHPQSDNQSGEGKADRALCKECQSAGDVSKEIIPAQERQKCSRKGEGKKCIRDGAAGQYDDLQRGGTDDRTDQSSSVSDEFSGSQIQINRRQCTEKHRGKPGGNLRDSEERKGNSLSPIKKGRLVIPEFSVDPGREPVGKGNHFLGGFSVDRFVRIKEGNIVQKKPVGKKAEQEKPDGRTIIFHDRETFL